jgi:hypothetical protein
VAEVTPDQVARLLRAVETANETQAVVDAARDALDHALLSTAREARVGLRELSALTGLHANTVRAGIQRAAGPTMIDFEQPELDFDLGMSEDLSAVRAAFPGSAREAVQAAPVAHQVRPAVTRAHSAAQDLGR